MSPLLRWTTKITTRHPVLVVIVLTGAVLDLGSRAATIELEVDMTQFGDDDSPAVQAMDRVREDFNDPSALVQVIVDAGPGGDVLSPDGIATVEVAQERALAAAGTDSRSGPDGSPQVMSVLDGPDPALLSDDAAPPGGAARHRDHAPSRPLLDRG